MFKIINPVTSAIDIILNAFIRLCYAIFSPSGDGYMRLLINTIMSNNYLLIGTCLLVCGFVLGIIKRLISM